MDCSSTGKIDAFLALPPTLQEVRARNIGHVIVSSITDRPWSQYYLLHVGDQHGICPKISDCDQAGGAGNFEGRRSMRYPSPQRVAQLLVDRGYTDRYDYALQSLSEVRYDVWRDFDPEDSLRFYALRMHEAGLIKSSPQKLIAEHTDWRFLNEVKRELKV